MKQPGTIVVIVLILAVATLSAQQPERDMLGHDISARRGADVFAKTCTGFCHGENGTEGNGAPRLAGRGLDAAYIEKVITFGIPGTQMPAWGQKMPQEDTLAVIAYVKSLNGLAPQTPGATGQPLSPEATRGRNLFFDTTGELKGCSNCHRVEAKGVPVAPPIASVPSDAAALRNLTTPQVQNASLGGEAFPALVVTQQRDSMKLYDLTSVPPVLRITSPAAVKISGPSNWRHTLVLGGYSDAELESILAFLRSASGR